ncbi:MAG: NAD(P)-dependent oxidoreductase [Nitratireductor sp.]|nr:NAD(P)-dependent oxidoreductase [Nitratireductor sp.]
MEKGERQVIRQILLTGASGRVAGMLRPLLCARYEKLILTDRIQPESLENNEEFRAADLADAQSVLDVCRGVDSIIHLGGQSNEADWETVKQINIDGMYNLLDAAHRNDVDRFVFASTNHVVGMVERSKTVGIDARVRPDSRYGVSKVFGEALASFYADKYAMRVLSIRIGHVNWQPSDMRQLSIWVHPEDLMQLIAIGLESDAVRNEVVYGVSDNARSFWDNAEATRLGYLPQHTAEDHLEAILALESKRGHRDSVSERFQGGDFAAAEYTDPKD